MSTRKFGVELEIIGLSVEMIQTALKKAGFECANCTRGGGGVTLNTWKVVCDSSIAGDFGYEVVSPPLSGQSGLNQVMKVANALRKAGGTVDSSCGLHVHVDAKGLTGGDLRNLVRRYAQHETAIDGFHVGGRRGGRNWVCGGGSMSMLLSRCVTSDFHTSNDPKLVAGAVNDRYFKVNLLAYDRHGTVEFRQHNGSVSGEKITTWIQFCVAFVEASRVRGSDAVVRGARGRRPLNKLGQLAEFLDSRRNGGASAGMIALRYGWSESSVAVQISTLRHRHNCAIQSARGRYYLTFNGYVTPSTVTSVRVTARDLTGDDLWSKIPAEVKSYYIERAMELASR